MSVPVGISECVQWFEVSEGHCLHFFSQATGENFWSARVILLSPCPPPPRPGCCFSPLGSLPRQRSQRFMFSQSSLEGARWCAKCDTGPGGSRSP